MKKYICLFLLVFFLFFTNNLFSQNNSCCDYSPTSQHPGESSETFGVTLGDIDGDGDMDAAIVDAYDDMEVYLNDGTGSFTLSQTYGTSESWFGIYLVDIDADSDLDIVVSGFYSGAGCEVWKNDGTGVFSLWQDAIATSIAMEELAIGDMNGDGSPDIFAPASSGGGSEVWFNNGSGTFINSGQSLSGSSCTQAVLADFDGDFDLDVYVSRTNGNANNVWLNDGSGFFTNSGQSLGNSTSTGVDAADVDDDGDIDVVTSNWQSPSQVWLNDGYANFTAGFQILNNNDAKAIVMSDVDHDCDMDAVIGAYGSNGVQVWTNDGTGTFSNCYADNAAYAHDIAVGDLNNDRVPDIWVGNFSSSQGDYIYLKATPATIYDTLTLCPGDSVFVGCNWRNSSGDFLEALNCDTLVWYHVSEIIIDTSITQNGDTLFVSPNYTTYQWLDCETMAQIPGANNYYYVSDTSGYFAVEITNQGCVDTSTCHWVQIPTADFTGSPTSGDGPLLVSFTDLSVDSVNTWNWDFGDGNTSTTQNPTNEYTGSGDFSVTLIVSGPGGIDTLTKTNYIHVNYPVPTADFSGTPTSGIVPLEVSFIDLSTDSVDTWLWEFGDEGISTAQSPVYTYYQAGTYTVSLTASGPGGSNTATKTGYIVVSPEPPVADFSGTPTVGNAPLEVTFTDLSSGTVDSWLWDFGNGDTSSLQSPVYTYNLAGTYTVSLTVSNSGGSSQTIKTDYITVLVNAPVADFSGTPTVGEAPLLVSFTDLSTGSIDTWNWHFGDNDSSAIQNPTHEYVTSGSYTVSLTVSGTGGVNTNVKTDYILIPVGIGKNNIETIMVYPNPVIKMLHIEFPNATNRTLSLKNTNGKLVWAKTITEEKEAIPMQAFDKGIYFLSIKTDKDVIGTIKIIKK